MKFLDCKRRENRRDNSLPRVSPSQRANAQFTMIINLLSPILLPLFISNKPP